MIKCSRCKRERKEQYMIEKKNKYTGKMRWRCRARSVCSSIARRNRDRSN